VDAGRCHTALHYIEELTKVIGQNAAAVDGDLIDAKSLFNQLLQLAEHLKFKDPMYTTGEDIFSTLLLPAWIFGFPEQTGLQFDGVSI
jgi:hypothetical protein